MSRVINFFKSTLRRIRLEIAYRKSLKNAKEKDPFIY